MKFANARSLGLIQNRSHQRSPSRYAKLADLPNDLRKRNTSTQGCYWCGLPFQVSGAFVPTKEHVNPKANGGTNDKENIGRSHLRCNGERGCDTNWVPFLVHGRLGYWGILNANGNIMLRKAEMS